MLRRTRLPVAMGLAICLASSGCTIAGERAPVPVQLSVDLGSFESEDRTLLANLEEAAAHLDRLHRERFQARAAGCYPDDLSRRDLQIYLDGHPDQRAELLDPYTVIQRREDRLVGIPFTEAFAPDLARIADALLRAADRTDVAEFRQFLRARALALTTGDYESSERDWLATGSSRVQAWFGPAEVADDPLMGVKRGYQAWVAVVDLEEQARLDRYAGFLGTLEADLSSNPKHSFEPPRLRVVSDFARTGHLRGSQDRLRILPQDETLRNETGRTLVFAKNVYMARAAMNVAERAELVLHPLAAEEVTPQADFNLTIWHYFAHAVGPKAWQGPSGTVPLKEQFAEYHGALEEAKAELVAFLALERLAGSAFVPATWTWQHDPTFIVNQFKIAEESRRGSAPDQHGKAALLILNWLLDKEAMELRYRRWILRPLQAPVRELVREILAIQESGDVERAGIFVHRFSQPNARFDNTLDDLRNVRPIRIEPQFRVID